MTHEHTTKTERDKYRRVWSIDAYRSVSPGEGALRVFRQMTRKRTGTLLDLGCGTGRAGLALSEMGFDVTLADFVGDACLDDNVKRSGFEFLSLNVFGRWPSRSWDWVYCCDVMEHIPPGRVETALSNIAWHCDQAFFSICFNEDHFGSLIGEALHLTVQPFSWWRDRLRAHGYLYEARDMMGFGIFRLVTA